MNRVLFVTGATKNTGLAIARKFAQNGYSVALSSRRPDDAEAAARNIAEEFGVTAKGYGLNPADTDDIFRVFDLIRDDFGRLDTFAANSANLGVDLDILSATPEDYDAVMDVNLKGGYFCCQRAARLMRESGGGSIVVIGSVHCNQAIWGRSLYAASKGGLKSLTRSMAVELGEYGIRANCIIAGAIHTERWNSLSEQDTAVRRGRYPVGRESYPDDIANAAFYLGTDLSGTVTGTDITVDSGISVCLLPYHPHNG